MSKIAEGLDLEDFPDPYNFASIRFDFANNFTLSSGISRHHISKFPC